MPDRKTIVEKYIEGFCRSDHNQILSRLTNDIVWEIHGFKTIQGKNVFDAEIENEGFEGSPATTIGRLIEEGGSVTKKYGENMKLVFSEVFTFTGNLVSRLEIYHVWLAKSYLPVKRPSALMRDGRYRTCF